MSTLLGTAIAVEARKARGARVMLWITVALLGGLGALTVGMRLGAASGDAQVLAKLGPLADVEGWAGLVGVVVQITAAGGLLAFGVALSWIFGREFADGTVTGLFALPVRRSAIAIAKLVVFLGWAVGVAVLATSVIAAVGLLLGYADTDAAGAAELVRVPVLVLLTALIATPAALAASLGRGLLPGIAATVGTIVLAQVMAVIGVGEWVPFVTPALWAIAPSTVSPAALVAVLSVPLVFGALTTLVWARLQLDR
ncbi:ABC transporter permease [Agromyces salentinus]|uniref:ABC transporter permease n=1 Tax=Agromyces salentinus TaxID=269421 RepID=A0ABN2MRN3_9MICO|nr:ABC transporter permease [Agromyces salentinus]